MLRFILLAILLLLIARLFWRLFDSVLEAAGATPKRRRAQPPSVRLVRDPVCGTHVAPASALSLTADGSTHYFCSQACRDEFSRQQAAGSRR